MPSTFLILAACALTQAPSDQALLTRNGHLVSGRPIVQEQDCLLVRFENGDVRVPMDLVLEVHLAEGGGGQQAAAGRGARALEVESQHSSWGKRQADATETLRWEFTLPRQVLRPLQERAEAFQAHFEEHWQLEAQPHRPQLNINVMRNPQQFQRVAGSHPGHSAYYMFIGEGEVNLSYQRQDPAATEADLYRTLCLDLQQRLSPYFRLPDWPRQGLAEFYGETRWIEAQGRFAWGGIAEDHLQAVQADLQNGEPLSLDQIVAGKQRAWSWALTEFLMQHESLAPRFEGYIQGLARDPNLQRVRGRFGLMTVQPAVSATYLWACLELDTADQRKAVQRALWKRLEAIEPCATRNPEVAAELAWNQGDSELARRCFTLAEQEAPLSAASCYRFAELLKDVDPLAAKAQAQQATRLDPLEGQFWLQLASLTEDPSEAARLAALAAEIGLEPWNTSTSGDTRAPGDGR